MKTVSTDHFLWNATIWYAKISWFRIPECVKINKLYRKTRILGLNIEYFDT